MKNNPFLKKTSLLLATVALLAMMVAPSFAANFGETTSSGAYISPHGSDYNGLINVALTPGDQYWNITAGHASMAAPSGARNTKFLIYNNATGQLLFTSSIVSVTSGGWYNYSFSSVVPPNMTLSIGVVIESTPVRMYLPDSAVFDALHDPNSYAFPETVWDGDEAGTTTPAVYIEATELAAEYEGPVSDPTWTFSTYDELIEDFTSFVVPLFVVLLPALLLLFITKRADKWILLIGLTIGAGLGYYFGMVPLWLVFLITIGLIGMAYQSVRGGDS